MGKYRVETEDGKVYEVETEDAPEPGMLESLGGMGKDFLAGVGSGVFSTAKGAASLLGLPESEYLNKLATAPESTAGQAGKFVEQGAEFLLPGGLVSKGAGALSGLSRAAQIAGRAGLEGLAGAGVAGIQSGGDPVQTATGFLGGTVAGAAAEAMPAIVAPWLKRTAVKQYGRAINPTKEANKVITDRIIPEAIARRETAGSLEKLVARAENRQEFFGKRIDDIWDQMEQQGVTAQADPILAELGQMARDKYHIQDATGAYVPIRNAAAESGMRELEKIAQTVQEAMTINPANGTREIPIKALRQLRDEAYKIAKKAKVYTADVPTTEAGEVHGRLGETIKNLMGQARPDLAGLNKEFSYWANLGDVTADTIKRRVGQHPSLYREIAKGAGITAGSGFMHGGLSEAAVGAVLGGAGMAAWKSLTSSPGWNMVSAVTKDRLAQAIANGNKGAATFYLGQAARAAGMEGAKRLSVSAEDEMPAPSGVADEEKVRRLMGGRPMIPVTR